MENDQDLIKAVFEACYQQDDRTRLTCTDVFKLAQQHGVELLQIAKICNQQKIKICKCQLGCFE